MKKQEKWVAQTFQDYRIDLLSNGAQATFTFFLKTFLNILFCYGLCSLDTRRSKKSGIFVVSSLWRYLWLYNVSVALILYSCKSFFKTSHLVICGWNYQECNLEEVAEEEEAPPSKSSKDKKANGPDAGKAPSLVFKITSRVPYKTVLKGTVGICSPGMLKIILIFNMLWELTRNSGCLQLIVLLSWRLKVWQTRQNGWIN